MTVRKRTERFYKKHIDPNLDEAAAVVSAAGGYYASDQYKKFFKDTRREYIKNVSDLTRRKRPKPFTPQLKLKGFDRAMRKSMGRVELGERAPYLTPIEAKRLKSRIYVNFKPATSSKFSFFPTSRKWIKAVINPYKSKQDLGIDRDALKLLRKKNKRSAFRSLAKRSPKALALVALTFGAIPATKAMQARYAKKRKFKKEVTRSIRRGAINPATGYFRGSALDKTLQKHPYLRASKTIRAREGRYAQQYGQGVQFWKGTSGMKAEEIKKLDRDTKRLLELRRIKKRRRGK